MWFPLLLSAVFIGSALSSASARSRREMKDIVGVCHINGFYHLTQEDFMNEGADKLLELGTRAIKLACRDRLSGYYPFNSQWPEVKSLIDVVENEHFRKVLEKPFTTYVLMTYTPGKDIHYFTNGMTPEDVERERQSFYEFTKYLLTKYRGTGKTFILQNWEGDWVLTPPSSDKEADPKAIKGMIDWLNARQDGVDRARREVGTRGVMVAHAAEVNLVDKAMQGKPSVTNSVLPFTHCDLYSYSSYDTLVQGPTKFRRALDYIAQKAPDSKLYGSKNVYIGEFGWPESLVDNETRLRIMREGVDVAVGWGVQYMLFWELYCDGPKHKIEGKPTNADFVGNWLIRPDGTKSPMWDYFHGLFASGKRL